MVLLQLRRVAATRWWLMLAVTSQQNVAKYLFVFLSEPNNSVEIVDICMILFSHCHHTDVSKVVFSEPDTKLRGCCES